MDIESPVVPTWRQRLKSALLDYLLIVAWLAVLTVVGVFARLLTDTGLEAPSPTQNLALIDLTAFVTTVLPVHLLRHH